MVWLLGFALALITMALEHELFMVFIVNTLGWGHYMVRFMNIVAPVMEINHAGETLRLHFQEGPKGES